MEQILLSLSQDQVTNVLATLFGIMLISLICFFGGLLNGRFFIGALFFSTLMLSAISYNRVEFTLSSYYKSLNKEYSLYQTNSEFTLIKTKVVNSRTVTERLKVECLPTESIKDCFINL